MAAMHRSQRTGEATWPTSRRSTSRPSCTTWPSALESSRVRGSWVEMARARRASRSTAGSMCTVWKAPATLSWISRARAGGAAASAASCSVVPAATIWPVPLLFAAVSPCSSRAASTSSGLAADHCGHRGGSGGAGGGHRPAALAYEHHGLLRRQHADSGRRGDLADRVAGGHADGREGVGRVREQLQRGQQAGGHQQRLGDRRVADGLGVRLGAVVRQVQAADRRQPGQPAGEGRGLGQPGLEEAGGLRALAGRHDREHTFIYSVTWR